MNKKILSLTLLFAALNTGMIFAVSNISIAQAKAIAQKKVPGGTVTSISLDYEKNRAIYDIDIFRNQYEYDLKLDATTGSGISAKKTARDDYAYSDADRFITMEKAMAIALKKVPGATIYSIALDTEAKRDIYEIELSLKQYEYDLKLDALTGSGISVKKELKEGAAQTKPQKPSTSTYITKEQAQAAALKKIPGATVRKIELDREDGVYELELRKGKVNYDVTVSATSGKVLSCEIDD